MSAIRISEYAEHSLFLLNSDSFEKSFVIIIKLIIESHPMLPSKCVLIFIILVVNQYFTTVYVGKDNVNQINDHFFEFLFFIMDFSNRI
jgi:hypothetical protein